MRMPNTLEAYGIDEFGEVLVTELSENRFDFELSNSQFLLNAESIEFYLNDSSETEDSIEANICVSYDEVQPGHCSGSINGMQESFSPNEKAQASLGLFNVGLRPGSIHDNRRPILV